MIRAAAYLLAVGLVSLPAGAQEPAVPAELHVPTGFSILTIAHVPGARELVAVPNGDLVAGTKDADLALIRHAEDAAPSEPETLAHLPEAPAAGIAFSAMHREIYAATEYGIYALHYVPGAANASAPHEIARVRTGPVAPNSDGDVHITTSLAFDDATNTLYAAVGSSCNACVEADPTRASIFAMRADGSQMHKIATRIRNAVALAIDPETHALWAGDAGQDDLPFGHPYEFLDAVTIHRAVADYGWPECEENRHAYAAGARCASTVEPLVEVPAYSTFIGAAFYPSRETGAFAFSQRYRGGIFAAVHGSWHRATGGSFAAQPQVIFVAMSGGRPARAVDWNDPSRQWQTFVGGFQIGGSQRVGRPTGIAIGPKGSLFVADDSAGVIYRIRPAR
ncbi:MAG: PQQ-dependent sugar dehydrogenase [Candidatus Eremiobacteraeota bacterium]|nr:PQQ-dependent sugar dehydrogenase [Candidatus Eremiobacteraeota bacterium]